MTAAAPARPDCWGALDEAEVTGAVSAALGRPVRLAGFETTPVAYEPGSPATGALVRVAGATTGGQPWSLFLKVLQHPRHWPRLEHLPAEVRQLFLDRFPWRGELVAWEPGFADRLPGGLRLPRLHRLVELGDDRLAVWMEDVRTLDDAWDQARFARAARALGGLAARRSDPALLAASPWPAGAGLRYYSGSRRAGCRCSRRTASGPIRWSPHAVGFDLGQLLVGLVHAGQLPASSLPGTHAVLVPAFTDGLHAGGGRAAADQVAFGYVASLAVRTGFTSLPFERLGEPATPALAATFRERAALTRFIADLALSLPSPSV